MKKLVQRLLFGIGILSLGITFTGCHASHSQTDSQKTISRQKEPKARPTETETSSTLSLIDASGMTLESASTHRTVTQEPKKPTEVLQSFCETMPWSLIKVPFYYMTAVKNAIKRLMLPYLISHLNMRISSNARIPPSGYMQNIFGVQSNTIALLFILRMDLTPSIRSGQTVTVSV